MYLTENAKRYRKKHGIPMDTPKKAKLKSKRYDILTYGGISLRAIEWAERLGVTMTAFAYRRRVYGDSDERTFLSKKESQERQLKNHFWPARDKANLNGGGGNEEWRSMNG